LSYDKTKTTYILEQMEYCCYHFGKICIIIFAIGWANLKIEASHQDNASWRNNVFQKVGASEANDENRTLDKKRR
jgi:hypothetical protein